jgi:S-adenosylmethionine uptake transporter
MLGETIAPRAIFASIMGIVGVFIILSDRIGNMHYDQEALNGAAAILVSALLYAYNLILQRRQAQIASPKEVVFAQSLSVAMFLFIAAPLSWVLAPLAGIPELPLPALPPMADMPSLILAAVLGTVSLGLLSWAYARAEAQILVATEYTAFIWAALLGWIFYAEAVTLATLSGASLIVAGCIIASREAPKKAVT